MTHDQQIAISHWFMFGSDGAPVRKRNNKWWVATDETSCLRIISAGCPCPFRTKREAIDWWDNICLQRSREWRQA